MQVAWGFERFYVEMQKFTRECKSRRRKNKEVLTAKKRMAMYPFATNDIAARDEKESFSFSFLVFGQFEWYSRRFRS